MRLIRVLFVLAAVISLSVIAPTRAEPPKDAAAKPEIDYLVITANDLAPAAQEWADYRAKQGRKTKLMKVGDIATNWGHEFATSNDIKNSIKGAAGESISADFQVLLVGDCPADAAKPYDPKTELPWFVSTFKDEQGDLIPGDNFYADLLKNDDMPEIAVGRIPARTVEDVRVALGKVKAYEAAKYGDWVKRVQFFAGEGHYGMLIDSMIEQAFIQFADEHIDNAYDLRMTYANMMSPYAWVPSKFSDKVIEEANEGGLLLTYLGHGSPDRLDDMRVKVGDKTSLYPILTGDDVAKFDIKDGKLPIMQIIACDTGWLDAAKPCLAEKILFKANAPVAVIAASRNSHPYSNMVVQKGIVQGVCNKKLATLGATFLYMKRELVEGAEPDRAQLEMMASMLMPKKADRDAQNVAHLYDYNLIGDPGLRIKHGNVKASAVKPMESLELGKDCIYKFAFEPGIPASPAAGTGEGSMPSFHATLEARRSEVVGTPAAFEAKDLFSADAKVREAAEKCVADNHDMANKKAVAEGTSTSLEFSPGACLAGTFEFHLKDTLAPGEYLVKIFALDAKGEHCGFAVVPLKVEKKIEKKKD